jgi:hypothetical protein
MAPAETACVVDTKKAPEAPGFLVSVKWLQGRGLFPNALRGEAYLISGLV